MTTEALTTERVRLLRRSAVPFLIPLTMALTGCALVWTFTPRGELLAPVLHVQGPVPPAPPLIAGEPPVMRKAEILSRTLWRVWVSGEGALPEQRRFAPWLRYELILLAAALTAISIVQVNPLPRRVRGRLRVDPDGATWNGAPLLARARIAQGLLRPGPRARGVIVRLVRTGLLPRGVELWCKEPGIAREILWRLRLDAAQAAATFSISSLANTHGVLGPVVAVLRVLTVLVVGALAIGVGFGASGHRVELGIGLAVVLLVLWAMRNWPVRVTVGTDGVLVRWLVLERFVAFPLRAIEPFDFGVRLVPREGEPTELCVFRVPWWVPKRWLRLVQWVPLWLSVHRELLLARVQAAARARSPQHADEPSSAEGGRATGDAASWVRAMREAPPEHVDRTSEPALIDLVEDSWQPATLRAQAALTLWNEAPLSGFAHVEALAEATAHPALRRLFAALARRDRRGVAHAAATLGVTPPGAPAGAAGSS